ncbi:MAG: hypothetical protein ACN6OC_14795 [Alcaligenes sp.]
MTKATETPTAAPAKKAAAKTGNKTAARKAAKTAAPAEPSRQDVNPAGSWPFPTGKRP